jgi:hypothetical protein
MGPTVSVEWSYRGLRTEVLENRMLRVIMLPEAGAKIWQIIYKPLDVALLWNNPRIPPARLPLNSRYDDVWSGGWDELFPNDAPVEIDGEAYPDHGELWTGEWTAEPFQTNDEAGVRLRFTTPVSAISVEKTIRVGRDSARVHFHHVFQNLGLAPFPFLWKLHPAMAVTPRHRIDFPAMKVVLEPSFPGTLGGGPERFDWPSAKISDRDVDLRRVPFESERQLYFFYGTEMAAGWCALTNTETRLACGIVFDRKVFPSCWLFASYGGWRNYNVAVIEPCTGYPLNFEAMRAAGRERTLAPGEKLSSDVLLTVQEGIAAVSNVEPDGTMVER